MSSPYSVARRAELDLDEIWAYIGTDNISAANRMMDRFRQKFAMLGRQPLIGETCGHL